MCFLLCNHQENNETTIRIEHFTKQVNTVIKSIHYLFTTRRAQPWDWKFRAESRILARTALRRRGHTHPLSSTSSSLPRFSQMLSGSKESVINNCSVDYRALTVCQAWAPHP